MNPSLVSLPGTVGPVMTMQNAIVEAACLGHQWVGPEHVLLAILNEQPPTLAREALNDVGITYDQTRKRFLASLLVGQPPIRSSIADGATACPAPVFYEIKGWIEGFAAALGRAPDETTALWRCAGFGRICLDQTLAGVKWSGRSRSAESQLHLDPISSISPTESTVGGLTFRSTGSMRSVVSC